MSEVADSKWWEVVQESDSPVKEEICVYAINCPTVMHFDGFQNFCCTKSWIHCDELPDEYKDTTQFKPVKEWVKYFKGGKKE